MQSGENVLILRRVYNKTYNTWTKLAMPWVLESANRSKA